MASVSVSNIKQLLSEEIAAATKKLQRDHIGTDSAIRSGDTANRICNVLEAIFLHELKESYEVKAFWPFVAKFTHRDVCKQIESLSQITTDVGRCRAWIRLALNDCLFESYMDSMLRDAKTVKQFYKRTAYIRDVEHPEIMKKCAQGLSNFYFQLSLNSSVINMWGSSPKMLSGRWQPPVENHQTNSPTLSQKSSEESEDSFVKTQTPRVKPRKGSGARRTEKRNIPPRTPEKLADSCDDSSFRECEMSRGLLHTPSEGSLLSMDSNGEKFSALSNEEEEDHSNEIPSTDFYDIGSNHECVDSETREAIFTTSDEPLEADNHVEDIDTLSKKLAHINISNECSDKLEETNIDTDSTNVDETLPSDLMEDSIYSQGGTHPSNLMEDSIYSQGRTLPSDLMEDSIYSQGATDSLGITGNYSNDAENSTAEEVQEIDEEVGGVSVPALEQNNKEEIFGNSLGARGGWSSQFENNSKTTRKEGQSYTSLLNTYAENSTDPMPSAIDTKELLGKIATQPGQEKTSNDLAYDDLLADYDIISSIPSSAMFFSDHKVQQLLAIVSQISREKGLDSQNYQCKGCTRPIGIIYGKAKVCSYDACYYCNECHLDEESVIPSKILHNWDFRKHKVANYTKMFLQQVDRFPLIDVSLSNPKLYDAITEAQDIKILRSQLKYLKAYLFTCKQSTAEELKKKVSPREYMLDHAHLYSVLDFHHVHSGQLAKDLKKVINWAAKHVYNCDLCRQKGFICELCDNPKVIYPFDVELTTRCDCCKTVFHKACRIDHEPCSKCTRIKQRRSQLTNPAEPVDFSSPWSL